MSSADIKQCQSNFRILEDWTIKREADQDYTREVHCNWKKRIAVICPWGPGDEPDDYIFHEILHICMGEIMYNRKLYKRRREAEELFVQDLCELKRRSKL